MYMEEGEGGMRGREGGNVKERAEGRREISIWRKGGKRFLRYMFEYSAADEAWYWPKCVLRIG